MPIEIARKHGLKHGLTETELVANAIKECSEAHQAKLLGAPLQKLEREIREAAIALLTCSCRCGGTTTDEHQCRSAAVFLIEF